MPAGPARRILTFATAALAVVSSLALVGPAAHRRARAPPEVPIRHARCRHPRPDPARRGRGRHRRDPGRAIPAVGLHRARARPRGYRSPVPWDGTLPLLHLQRTAAEPRSRTGRPRGAGGCAATHDAPLPHRRRRRCRLAQPPITSTSSTSRPGSTAWDRRIRQRARDHLEHRGRELRVGRPPQGPTAQGPGRPLPRADREPGPAPLRLRHQHAQRGRQPPHVLGRPRRRWPRAWSSTRTSCRSRGRPERDARHGGPRVQPLAPVRLRRALRRHQGARDRGSRAAPPGWRTRSSTGPTTTTTTCGPTYASRCRCSTPASPTRTGWSSAR